MQVRDLLLEALARANHVQRGFSAEASEITTAERQFNAQLRKYSDQNMVTAYQKVFDFIPDKESVIIGAPSYKKGVRVTEVETLPSVDEWQKKLVAGRDYVFSKETGKYYTIKVLKYTGTIKVNNQTGYEVKCPAQEIYKIEGEGVRIPGLWHTDDSQILPPSEVTEVPVIYTGLEVPPDPDAVIGYPWTISGTFGESSAISLNVRIMTKVVHYTWQEVTPTDICEFVPDVKLNDMERIMAVMRKNANGVWVKLQFCPLTEFYCSSDKDLYTTSNAGENKVSFVVKLPSVNNDIKIIYNSSMKFAKNDYLELPEAHIELLTAATTVAILMEDCDADPKQLDNYRIALKELEDQIIASTTVNRRIVREECEYRYDNRLGYLASGDWLFGGRH